jgi:hypothetical protein
VSPIRHCAVFCGTTGKKQCEGRYEEIQDLFACFPYMGTELHIVLLTPLVFLCFFSVHMLGDTNLFCKI